FAALGLRAAFLGHGRWNLCPTRGCVHRAERQRGEKNRVASGGGQRVLDDEALLQRPHRATAGPRGSGIRPSGAKRGNGRLAFRNRDVDGDYPRAREATCRELVFCSALPVPVASTSRSWGWRRRRLRTSRSFSSTPATTSDMRRCWIWSLRRASNNRFS